MKNYSITKTIKQFPGTFWVANTMEIFERMAWYGFFALSSLYITGSVSEGGLGLSSEQRGVIQGVGTFILYIIPVLTGALADRYGYKKMFFIAYAIMTPSYFLLGQFTSYTGFFTIFMFLALGAAVFKPVVVGTIAHVTSNETKPLGFAIFYMMVNIGGFVGPIVAGVVRGWSWDWVFAMSSIWIGFNFFWLLIFFKEPTTESTGKNRRTLRKVLDDAVEVLGNGRLFLTVFVILILFMVAGNKWLTWTTSIFASTLWLMLNLLLDAALKQKHPAPTAILGLIFVPIFVAVQLLSLQHGIITALAWIMLNTLIYTLQRRTDQALCCSLSTGLLFIIAGAIVGYYYPMFLSFSWQNALLLALGWLMVHILIFSTFRRNQAADIVILVGLLTIILPMNFGLIIWQHAAIASLTWFLLNLLIYVKQRGINAFPSVGLTLPFFLAGVGVVGFLICGYFEIITWVWAIIGSAMWLLAPVLIDKIRRREMLGSPMKLGDWRFALFLLILSGFWTSFQQIFITMPEYIRDFVDTNSIQHSLGAFFSSIGLANFWHWIQGGLTVQSTGQIKPEMIINIDAGAIILFQLLITKIFGRSNPIFTMIMGTLIAAIGIAMGAISSGWIIVLAIFIFAIGEMAASPKSQEYIGRIAPPQKVALFMGYYFVTIALGNLFGGILSGQLYGMVKRGEMTPNTMWSIFGSIGIITAIGLVLYDRFALPKPKTDVEKAAALGPMTKVVITLSIISSIIIIIVLGLQTKPAESLYQFEYKMHKSPSISFKIEGENFGKDSAVYLVPSVSETSPNKAVFDPMRTKSAPSSAISPSLIQVDLPYNFRTSVAPSCPGAYWLFVQNANKSSSSPKLIYIKQDLPRTSCQPVKLLELAANPQQTGIPIVRNIYAETSGYLAITGKQFAPEIRIQIGPQYTFPIKRQSDQQLTLTLPLPIEIKRDDYCPGEHALCLWFARPGSYRIQLHNSDELKGKPGLLYIDIKSPTKLHITQKADISPVQNFKWMFTHQAPSIADITNAPIISNISEIISTPDKPATTPETSPVITDKPMVPLAPVTRPTTQPSSVPTTNPNLKNIAP